MLLTINLVRLRAASLLHPVSRRMSRSGFNVCLYEMPLSFMVSDQSFMVTCLPCDYFTAALIVYSIMYLFRHLNILQCSIIYFFFWSVCSVALMFKY